MQAMRAIDRAPLSRSLGLSVNLTRQLETRFFPNSFHSRTFFRRSPCRFRLRSFMLVHNKRFSSPPQLPRHPHGPTTSVLLHCFLSHVLSCPRFDLLNIIMLIHSALSNPIIALTNTFSGNISQVILRARLRDSDTSPCNSSSFTFLGDSLMGYPSSS